LTQCNFETEPGEQGRVDWGQVRVQFAAGPATVHVFVLTLSYSRRAWAEGYENERMDSLQAAHQHAFSHFGGRPAELLYDRMRTVTMKPAAEKAKWNPTLESFFGYWGFAPRLCRADILVDLNAKGVRDLLGDAHAADHGFRRLSSRMAAMSSAARPLGPGLRRGARRRRAAGTSAAPASCGTGAALPA
jgi:transposase